MTDIDDLCPSRRTLLRGLAGAVLLPGVLVACSSGESGDGTTGGASGSGTSGGSSAGSGTVPASQVPVGEARVVQVDGRPVVLAQPVEGEFVAFSATCTHQGTTVEAGSGLTLTCPNHGSRFDARDGAVQNGPATSPLVTVPVSVQGEDLVLG